MGEIYTASLRSPTNASSTLFTTVRRIFSIQKHGTDSYKSPRRSSETDFQIWLSILLRDFSPGHLKRRGEGYLIITPE